jgi:hypothetical protein
MAHTGRCGPCLVTALCDAPGELLPKAEKLWGALEHRFSAIAVHITHDTHRDWRRFLSERGTPIVESRQGWDVIGLHRRRSLELGLSHSTDDRFFYADPDHILRWVERNPAELDAVLGQADPYDCLVIGRSPAAFAATPERLRATETIVNRIYTLITGRDWDLMIAARGLSRRAAELIVRECEVDTLGNDVAWPLLVERDGLTLGYAQADGLTYETNTVYAANATDVLDHDPRAWMLRVYAANQHVDAMRPFLE